MTTESRTAESSLNVMRLRMAMGALTVVNVVAFIAVGALAPAILFAVIGGAITALLRPSRMLVIVVAGLVGLLVAGLVANFLLQEGSSDSWGEWVFLIGGGLTGIAVMVLAGMSLTASRKS